MTPGSLIPMTPSQSLIWMGQALAEGSPLYNMAWRFDLKFALRPDLFATAFESVFHQQDALATCFAGQGSAVVQRIAEPRPFPPMLDFSAETDPMEAADAWVRGRAKRRIDLSVSTYDTCLIKLADEHWVWFLNQHHIATDAWSGSLIYKAVAARYDHLDAGATSPEPIPAFADYAHGIEPGDSAYWSEKIGKNGLSPAPYSGQRDLSAPASHRRIIDFGPSRAAALRALAGRDGFRSISADLSIFAVLATTYAAYLYRVTGQERVTIGTPSHNRATPELKTTPGLFIEMFPLCIDVDPEQSFAELYKSVMVEALGFLRHARPGASNAAIASSFNAVLNYIPVQYGTFAGHEADTTWLHTGAHDARHDLRLHVYDFTGSDRLTVAMDFNSTVFDMETIEDATGHFLWVFDAFAEDPDQLLGRVPLDSGGQIALISGESGTSGTQSVLSRFARNAAQSPESGAVACQGRVTTYRALDAASDGVAAALKDQGVAPGDRVLVHACRSAELVAAILGVLKCGAAFVPVSADTPAGRLAVIAEEARPKAVVVDRATRAAGAQLDVALLDLEAPVPEGGVPVSTGPTDAAYVMFTSGSTGTPKGVVVDHAGLAEYVRWAAGAFGAGVQSYPLYSSIGFDLTITSLFVPLVTGGTVVVYPETAGGTDLAVLDVFRDDVVDVVKLTPSHLALVCEQGLSVQRISALVLGGENLPASLARRALDQAPDLRIINEYGPTEAVVGCMIHVFDAARDLGASVPIGRPSENMSIYVLDAGLNPVPAGVTGEIFIGGARLAQGYLGRDDLTAERFVADPFAPGGRMYRTGDLARVDRAGTVHYLGRADAQLKIGGVRIEPAEIEAVLVDVPGVERVFVTTWQKARPVETRKTACVTCGIASDFPGTSIGPDGVCGICTEFQTYRERANAYFREEAELAELVRALPALKTGKYDAIVLFSGGKDSTYALYRFAELTSDILALTLDNGFLSEGAKANIRRVADDLGVDHRFMTTPAMNAIFNDSLTRHSNVCQGCFKTIYTLALQVARKEGIPAVVTGLSRGQFFETRLSPELFAGRTPDVAELEAFVLEARKAYHRMDDAIARLLDTAGQFDDGLFEAVELVDIYRYIDVPVEEIYRFLAERAPWVRPDDTGRSTNCLINDVGIYVHRKREGFHNYALPYSWDVRMGHKTRDGAMAELDDEIDVAKVHAILGEIGFDMELLEGRAQLVAYVVGEADEAALRSALTARLLPGMVPAHIVRLDALPLTGNGKVDTGALPDPVARVQRDALVAPSGQMEQQLAAIFQSVIGLDAVGVTANFYDMGGDSIAAIQIAIAAADAGIAMEPNAVFEHQTIRELAAAVDVAEAADDDFDGPLLEIGNDDMAALARQLDGLR